MFETEVECFSQINPINKDWIHEPAAHLYNLQITNEDGCCKILQVELSSQYTYVVSISSFCQRLNKL